MTTEFPAVLKKLEDNNASNCQLLDFLGCNLKKLRCQYKDYLREFKQWKEKKRQAREWMLFPEHIEPFLFID